ncbi:MAG: sulfatase [Bacillota bacterium]|nr:sulfatase [Bacillota bacterium]
MPTRLPNIILIVLDTARAKSFSCYGYHRSTTLHLSRLVEEGVLHSVKWCFSTAPWTLPSHASIWSGLYPHDHGVVRGNFVLPENVLMLPELLKMSGYHTYGFSANFLVSRQFGFARGFDKWWEVSRELLPEPKCEVLCSRLSEVAYYLRNRRFKELSHKVVNYVWRRIYGDVIKDATPFTGRILDRTLRILTEKKDSGQPVFVFVNLMQAHERYNPPSQVRGIFSDGRTKYEDIVPISGFTHYVKKPISSVEFQALTALYDEELLYLDLKLNSFIIHLKKRGILNDTLIIITSDHGELIGEHDHYEHLFSVYNELIHVPLLVHFPKWIMPTSIPEFVQLTDIYATILNVIESPLPAPHSSYSFVCGNQRSYAISEFTDINLRLMGCKRYNPEWEWDRTSLNNEACLINRDTMTKTIVKPGNKLLVYNLNEDYFEQEPLHLDCSNDLKEYFRSSEGELLRWLISYIESVEVNLLD